MKIEEMLDEMIELAEEGIGYTNHYFVEKHKMNEQMDDVRGYKQQILSDFADKNLEIKRLEAEVERLKCCGNCVNYTYDMEEDHYYCNRHIFNGRLHANVCSNHWETDGLTAEKRK